MAIKIAAAGRPLSGLRISHHVACMLSVALSWVAAAIGLVWVAGGQHFSGLSPISVCEHRAQPMPDLARIEAGIREEGLDPLFAFEGAAPAAREVSSRMGSIIRRIGANTARVWKTSALRFRIA